MCLTVIDTFRFELAATVLRGPLALSRYDVEHSEVEERWITLGLAETGQLLVVVHTFEELSEQEARVRIISARFATTMNGGSMRAAKTQAFEATTMQNEYDFSNAQRGKFFRKDAVLELPMYQVRDYLAARAKDKSIEVNQLVNELLKRDIELSEPAK
jgi:uncharacterized DUF497 family protein